MGTHSLTHKRQFDNSFGDLWAATWADDDTLYLISDDTSGFDRACWSNLALSQLSGDSIAGLNGRTINPLSQFGAAHADGTDETGVSHPGDQPVPDTGEDVGGRTTWKGTGLACVEGTLYVALSRHRYGTPPYFIQQTWDAQIVASDDHGATWTRLADTPMFPGRLFSNPNFVQVGKDGAPTDRIDDGYLYAISNDGSWNNGNAMILGRVPRVKDAILDANAWQFWAGADSNGAPIWVTDLNCADFVFRSPGHTSMTGMTYLDNLGKFVMPQWYYMFDPTQTYIDWGQALTTTPTIVELYTADHPWGPWSLRHSVVSAEGWYNPCILAKPLAGLDPGTVPVLVAGLGGRDLEFYKLKLRQLSLALLSD
jgi:hypothetical protein